jgi:hypothetical protein
LIPVERYDGRKRREGERERGNRERCVGYIFIILNYNFIFK